MNATTATSPMATVNTQGPSSPIVVHPGGTSNGGASSEGERVAALPRSGAVFAESVSGFSSSTCGASAGASLVQFPAAPALFDIVHDASLEADSGAHSPSILYHHHNDNNNDHNPNENENENASPSTQFRASPEEANSPLLRPSPIRETDGTAPQQRSTSSSGSTATARFRKHASSSGVDTTLHHVLNHSTTVVPIPPNQMSTTTSGGALFDATASASAPFFSRSIRQRGSSFRTRSPSGKWPEDLEGEEQEPESPMNASRRLHMHCSDTDWDPDVNRVEQFVQSGADILYQPPSGADDPLLHRLLKEGAVEAVRACLATTKANIDFTVVDGCGQTPLHCVCARKISDAATAAMLEAICDRLCRSSSHQVPPSSRCPVAPPPDNISWRQRDHMGMDCFGIAAENQKLSVIWHVLRRYVCPPELYGVHNTSAAVQCETPPSGDGVAMSPKTNLRIIPTLVSLLYPDDPTQCIALRGRLWQWDWDALGRSACPTPCSVTEPETAALQSHAFRSFLGSISGSGTVTPQDTQTYPLSPTSTELMEGTPSADEIAAEQEESRRAQRQNPQLFFELQRPEMIPVSESTGMLCKLAWQEDFDPELVKVCMEVSLREMEAAARKANEPHCLRLGSTHGLVGDTEGEACTSEGDDVSSTTSSPTRAGNRPPGADLLFQGPAMAMPFLHALLHRAEVEALRVCLDAYPRAIDYTTYATIATHTRRPSHTLNSGTFSQLTRLGTGNAKAEKSGKKTKSTPVVSPQTTLDIVTLPTPEELPLAYLCDPSTSREKALELLTLLLEHAKRFPEDVLLWREERNEAALVNLHNSGILHFDEFQLSSRDGSVGPRPSNPATRLHNHSTALQSTSTSTDADPLPHAGPFRRPGSHLHPSPTTSNACGGDSASSLHNARQRSARSAYFARWAEEVRNADTRSAGSHPAEMKPRGEGEAAVVSAPPPGRRGSLGLWNTPTKTHTPLPATVSPPPIKPAGSLAPLKCVPGSTAPPSATGGFGSSARGSRRLSIGTVLEDAPRSSRAARGSASAEKRRRRGCDSPHRRSKSRLPGLEDEGWDFLSCASRHQRLSLFWPLLRRIPFYAGLPKPIPLYGRVWSWDLAALDGSDQAAFHLHDGAHQILHVDRATSQLYELTIHRNPDPVDVEVAVEAGAQIGFQHPDTPQFIPLHTFLTRGLEDCVRAVLQTTHRIDFRQKDSDGWTPLCCVLKEDHHCGSAWKTTTRNRFSMGASTTASTTVLPFSSSMANASYRCGSRRGVGAMMSASYNSTLHRSGTGTARGGSPTDVVTPILPAQVARTKKKTPQQVWALLHLLLDRLKSPPALHLSPARPNPLQEEGVAVPASSTSKDGAPEETEEEALLDFAHQKVVVGVKSHECAPRSYHQSQDVMHLDFFSLAARAARLSVVWDVLKQHPELRMMAPYMMQAMPSSSKTISRSISSQAAAAGTTTTNGDEGECQVTSTTNHNTIDDSGTTAMLRSPHPPHTMWLPPLAGSMNPHHDFKFPPSTSSSSPSAVCPPPPVSSPPPPPPQNNNNNASHSAFTRVAAPLATARFPGASSASSNVQASQSHSGRSSQFPVPPSSAPNASTPHNHHPTLNSNGRSESETPSMFGVMPPYGETSPSPHPMHQRTQSDQEHPAASPFFASASFTSLPPLPPPQPSILSSIPTHFTPHAGSDHPGNVGTSSPSSNSTQRHPHHLHNAGHTAGTMHGNSSSTSSIFSSSNLMMEPHTATTTATNHSRSGGGVCFTSLESDGNVLPAQGSDVYLNTNPNYHAVAQTTVPPPPSVSPWVQPALIPVSVKVRQWDWEQLRPEDQKVFQLLEGVGC